MRTFVQKALIRAPIERAWEVLADVERWPEWTASVRSVRLLSAPPLGVGSLVRVDQPKLQPAEFTITEWRPPHSFTWRMSSPGVSAVAAHSLRAVPEGCELELRLDFGGPLVCLVGWLAGKLTREYMAMEAEGLKKRAEQAT